MARSDDFYRPLFEFSMDAVLYTAPDGAVLAANPAACRLFDYSEAEICALGRDGLLDLSQCVELPKMLQERERNGRTEGELIYIHRDGRRFPGWTSSAVFVDGEGHPRTVIIIRDLTEAKSKEAALTQSVLELDDLYNNAPCGYHSVDGAGRIVNVNKTELSWLGYSRGEVIGKAFIEFLSPDSQAVYTDKFEDYKRSGVQKDLELELVQKNGNRRPILLNSTAIYDEYSGFVKSRSTLVDITDRKTLEQELIRQAHKDFLTGLSNRGHFDKLADIEFETCQRLKAPMGLLFFDIDDFKAINDTHGHHTGDLVLRAVGECCVRTMRKIDILGRWGGEEFVALLPGVSQGDVRETAERLREALAQVRVSTEQGEPLSFTVSVGATCAKPSDSSVNTLLKRADIALYLAKSEGKNCVMLDSDILT